MRFKPTERNILILIMLALSGMFVLRAFTNQMVYPIFVFSAIVVALCPLKICLPLMCYLLQFAYVFKMDMTHSSLFTVVFLIYIARIIFKKGNFNRMFLLGALAFGVYALVFSGMGKAITVISMVCGMVMVYDACTSDDYVYEDVLLGFAAGIIVSSSIGLFKENLPVIQPFLNDVTQKVADFEYVERFVGLNRNPNYYTMDISMVLSCLVANMAVGKAKPIYMVAFMILSAFGLMSVSKSFLIIWAVLLVLLIGYGIKNGGTMFLKILAALAVTAICVYVFSKDSVDAYLFRFNEDSTGDLNDITSGRLDIVFVYAKAMLTNIKVLLFGTGLGRIIEEMGTHNTYIELFYNLGIVGTTVFLFTLKNTIRLKNISREKAYFIPVIILLIRMLGIGLLTQDSLWYSLVLICLLLKTSIKQDDPETKINTIYTSA